MKILLLTPNFSPEKTGIGVSATDCANFIASFGNEVEVLTCLPHYPEWKVHEEYQGRYFIRENFAPQINVTRTWLYVPKKVRALGRIVHELTFALSTNFVSLWRNSDLILSISPPLSASLLAGAIAKLKRKPFWCYVQDIQPDVALCLGMLKNPFLRALSQLFERSLYRLADKILVLSDGMKQNLVRKGVPEEKVQVVPLSVDVSAIVSKDQASSESIFRSTYGLENRHVVLYSGTIGIKHHPIVLVECARALAHIDDIFFAIVGDGAAKEEVEGKIREYGLHNIRVLPLCERELLGDMLSSADTLVIAQRQEVLDIVVPSKVVTYLASKVPIVASVHPESEAAVLLGAGAAGIVVAAEDSAALAAAILEVYQHPAKSQSMADRGFELAIKTFDAKVIRDKAYAPLFGPPQTADRQYRPLDSDTSGDNEQSDIATKSVSRV